MTVTELKEALEVIIADGGGELPVGFFSNNHHYISDESNGTTTIHLCSTGRVDGDVYGNVKSYQKRFVLIGNYWGGDKGFKTVTQYINKTGEKE